MKASDLFPHLLSKNDFPCQTIETIDSTYEPPVLSAIFLACIKNARGKDAIEVFYLMMTFAGYDTMRVNGPTSFNFYRYQIPMRHTGYDGSSIFVREFSRTEKLTDERNKICRKILNIGKPSYFPEYAIRFSEGVSGPRKGNGIKPDFSSEESWKKALNFMKCDVN